LTGLSVGAIAAWQIAGWEAAWLKHQYVEKEHLLCGICGLGKVLDNEKVEVDERARTALQVEQGSVLSVLHGLKINPVQLRRQVRAALGRGSYERTEKVIHRSEECRRVFAEAGELAGLGGEINCLHLLGTIMKSASSVVRRPGHGHGRRAVLAEIGENGRADQQAGSDTPYLDRFGQGGSGVKSLLLLFGWSREG
jgi:ATP-dependent Clp protease ATP-binding subunit ClpA